MKKILGLGVVALLVIAMVGGGTYAFFSDTETSTNNSLMAGTLNLGVANLGGTNPTGSATATWTTPAGWKPGQSINGTLYVKNSGTIDMSSVNVTFAYTYTENSPSTVTGYAANTGTDNLSQMITAATVTYNGTSVASLATKNLDQLVTAGTSLLGNLPAGAEVPLFITFTLGSTATNGCQGDTANVTLTLLAMQ
jgi:spore coat-associated protein N